MNTTSTSRGIFDSANAETRDHVVELAQRIKELYGVVPGSDDFAAEQHYLQPPEEQTDIVHVIRGVIEAESGASHTPAVESTIQAVIRAVNIPRTVGPCALLCF